MHLTPFQVLALAGAQLRARLADDRGEGVISTAIVVLIMVAIGGAMYGGFTIFWQNADAKLQAVPDQIVVPVGP